MLSLHLPITLTRFFSAPSFVGAEAAAPATPVAAVAVPDLVSAYEDPPDDLDQRVRAMGEW
ncbi:hypothetical protein [Acidovorax sp. FG27]|uniref:hypothetical protein n=1 Tax=Acidovorax sp. FG27 TaxID=3133652 RepID=UPI0030EA4135